VPYPEQDIFGLKNRTIYINSNSATTFTLSNLLDTRADQPTEGQPVYVSFYLSILSGSITSITATMNGGQSVVVVDADNAPLDGFERYFYTLEYGTADQIDFDFKGAGNARMLLQGLQVTTTPHSTYIPTGEDAAVRQPDLLSLPFALSAPNAGSDWSLIFNHADLQINSRKKVIASSESGGFQIYIIDSDIIVKTGSTQAAITLGIEQAQTGGETPTFQAGEIALTYTAGELTLYIDGQFERSVVATLETVTDQFFYIGSESSGASAFGAYLSNVQLYDVQLTADQMTYFTTREPVL
jgi:hypothetical protein